MTTTCTGPTPNHDLRNVNYNQHSTDFGVVVFDERCRRCWYERAKAEFAPLLEAAQVAVQRPHDDRCEAQYGYVPGIDKTRPLCTCGKEALEAAIVAATGKE